MNEFKMSRVNARFFVNTKKWLDERNTCRRYVLFQYVRIPSLIADVFPRWSVDPEGVLSRDEYILPESECFP